MDWSHKKTPTGELFSKVRDGRRMHVPRKTGELDESSFSRSRMTARLMRRAERFREADEACQCGATRREEKMRWQSWREQIYAVGSAVGFEFCKTVAGSGKTNKHRVTILFL